MKRSGPGRPDFSEVRKRAAAVLTDYESGYSKTELADRLDRLYRDFAAHTDGSLLEQGTAPTMDQLRETAREIARDIIAESETETNPLYEEYSELRKELRTRTVSVSDDVKQGMTEAWADFRRKNMGRLRLGNKGTSVDVLYDELSGRFPELFPEDILNPADQLTRLAEVAGELQSVTENKYAGEMDLNTEYLAGELLEGYYDVPKKPTFADKQARKLAEQKDRMQARQDAALERQKAMLEGRSEREMEKLRRLREGQLWDQRKRFEQERARDRAERLKTVERQKERVAKRDAKISAMMESRKAEQAKRKDSLERDKLLNIARRLNRIKTTDANRETIDGLIGDLDLVAKSMSGKTLKEITDDVGTAERLTVDQDTLDKIARYDKTHINDMDIQDVRNLTNILLYAEKEMRERGEILTPKADSEERSKLLLSTPTRKCHLSPE